MKKFILHWMDGAKTEVEGRTISEAFTHAGFGAGAIRALDYYEEIKPKPDIKEINLSQKRKT